MRFVVNVTQYDMSTTATPTTYKETMAKIAELQEHAERLRKKEIPAVLADIRQKVAEYGLTPADIFGGKRAAAGKKSAPASKKVAAQVGVPKYRDPKTGATWTGRGRAPAWIAGRNRKRFEIAGQS